MRRAVDRDEFWLAPRGHYYVERAFLVFCAADDLWGYVMWGELVDADIRAITASVFHPGWQRAPAHRTLVDLRRVTAIDASAFTSLRATQTDHRDDFARRITRMAIVRPDGFIGAIAEGIANVVSFPHPVDVCATAEAALDKLGVADTGLVAELDAARLQLEPGARIVDDLRALFAAHTTELTLPEAAKRLGLSPRNLQRKLHDAGTTYLAERNRAQVAHAQRMMLDSDATISQIALDVGCGSLQHFSSLFRRLTGQTPSEWRSEHRRR